MIEDYQITAADYNSRGILQFFTNQETFMADLQDLDVIAGNSVVLTCTSDTTAYSVECSIVDANLNKRADVDFHFPTTDVYEEGVGYTNGGGNIVTIDLPPEMTMAARHRGTILQITWNLGDDHVENTRVNLVGVA